MAKPISSSILNNPSHSTLHNFHVDVKMFGAVGDGTTDDTTAIQNALDAGEHVFFPSGHYKVTNTLNLSLTNPSHIAGAVGTNNLGLGAYIKGNVAGPILSRGVAVELGGPTITNLAIENTNAAGTAINLASSFPPNEISRCYLKAWRCIVLQEGNINITGNRLVGPGGLVSGSIGIFTAGQTTMAGNDVVGFQHGYRLSGGADMIARGRVEVCGIGIMVGQDLAGANHVCNSPFIAGVEMEANDIGIQLDNIIGGALSGVHITGTAGSPSVGSLRGVYATGGAQYVTLSAITEGGSHATSFMNITGAGNKCVTIFDSSGVTWVFDTASTPNVSLIDCEINGVRKTRLSGPFAVPSKIEIALTAGQNDWNPTGLSGASAIRIDPNGAYTITGLQGGEEGRILHLMNISGTNAVTLAHESGSSTAANRFACPGGVNFAIPVAGGVDLFYDNNASIPRWRVMSK